MEEDLKILEEIKEIGGKWAQISKKLIGRNENNIKNRSFTLLGLHSLSRQKKLDILNSEEISQKIDSKMNEIKNQLALNKFNNDDSFSFTSIISSYINEESSPNNILKSPYLYAQINGTYFFFFHI